MPLLSLLLSALIAGSPSAPLPGTLPLDEKTFSRLPAATANLVAHGKSHVCTGVWLDDLASAAGLPSGDALRGPALTIVIVAEAADGYRVAFSLSDIDPKLGNKKILVTRQCDGRQLADEDGPVRLVVPGEARAARSVRRLQALRIVTLP